MSLSDLLNALVESDVPHEDGARLMKYLIGDDLKLKLKVLAGELVLNKKDLDRAGICPDKVKVLRYICLVLNAR